MPTLSFRLTELEKEELERVSGGNVSAYCKRTLFRQVERDLELERIVEVQNAQTEKLNEIAEIVSGMTVSGGIPKEVVSMIFEMRHLLQAISQPDLKEAARAEVERIGLPYVFSSDLKQDHD